MSLDVYLSETKLCPNCAHVIDTERCVFDANITHNLGKMASEAGIYDALWEPIEHGMTHAKDLIPHLRDGLEKLRAQPGHFAQFNAANGWGMYYDFVPWVERYLNACEENPDALVSVSR